MLRYFFGGEEGRAHYPPRGESTLVIFGRGDSTVDPNYLQPFI